MTAYASSLTDPYEGAASVPSFELRSNDIAQGEVMDVKHRSGIMGAGGEDVSPHLAWSGAPEGTKSYSITCFDPDAPTGSGFWHWVVADLPASVTEVASNAGDENGSGLTEPAFQIRNDAGSKRFIGAAPPSGHGPHRYFFTVHALDVETLGIDDSASPAFHGFNLFGHTLARATIVGLQETE